MYSAKFLLITIYLTISVYSDQNVNDQYFYFFGDFFWTQAQLVYKCSRLEIPENEHSLSSTTTPQSPKINTGRSWYTNTQLTLLQGEKIQGVLEPNVSPMELASITQMIIALIDVLYLQPTFPALLSHPPIAVSFDPQINYLSLILVPEISCR